MSRSEHTVGAGVPRRRPLPSAPADRPARMRGKRGVLAVFATIASLVVLREHSVHSAGRLGSGQREYEYVLHGPGWSEPAFLCAAGALMLAALLLWRTRRRAVVGLAVALLPLALGASVLTVVARESPGRVSAAALREARTLGSRSAVRDALGTPAGDGSMRTPVMRAGCDVYVNPKDVPWEGTVYGFCFRGGQVVGRFSEELE